MKVAVIIPCYNVAAYVERAVRSAWEQQPLALDLIAVDDGSTDATREVLQQLMKERPGMLHLITCAHAGASAARNTGLAATDARYIQFLDADDVLMPGKIAGQLALTAHHGGPSLIAGGYRNMWPDGRIQDVSPGSDPWLAVIDGRAGTTSANLWSRAAVVEAGGWDEQLASSQDHELVFRILRNGGSYVVDPHIAASILKRTADSISRTDPLGNWERYIALRAAIRDHLVATPMTGSVAARAECDRRIFGAVRAVARGDMARAMALHDRYLPHRYRPDTGLGVPQTYALVYRLFGLRVAEVTARTVGILRQLFHR